MFLVWMMKGIYSCERRHWIMHDVSEWMHVACQRDARASYLLKGFVLVLGWFLDTRNNA